MTQKHWARKIATLLIILIGALFIPILSASSNVSPAPHLDYSSYTFIPNSNYTQNDTKALFRINSDNSGLPRHNVVWLTPQGTTTDCRTQGGVCTTQNEYSPNGILTASTWEFYISGQQRQAGTYTAVVNYCTNFIGSYCIGWSERFRASFTISDGRYVISGNVGIAGATLEYVDGTNKTAIADGSGGYSISVPPAWSGTVKPSKKDYLFSPATRTYSNVQAHQSEQNFMATAMSYTYLPLVIR